MQIHHAGEAVRIADGGRPWNPDEPLVVLLHGAGMDRTSWQMQTRYLAHHGYRTAAVDLPGHGRSGGAPLRSVAEMADWTVGLIDALGGAAHLVGHSMGSYVAIEVAARASDRVASLVLLGTATTMPVHPELLSAAADDIPHASRLMTSWGHSPRAHVGRHATPGQWLLGGSTALLNTSPSGALAADMAACNAYGDSVESAASVRCPVTMVLGSADKMTPAKASVELQGAFPSTLSVVVLDRVGHMMMAEAPDRVRDEIVAALDRSRNPSAE